jgi:CMP-N-acetylneuraminic acid synthetase
LIVWAFIPARGGSKSIPKKNLVDLCGRALIDYGINAVIKSQICQRVICSTDDKEIADHVRALGVEVDVRKDSLSLDDTPVGDVVCDFLERNIHCLPDLVLLVQPTSPFLLSSHISELVQKVMKDLSVNSGQTIFKPPHNFHAWNQRIFNDGLVKFMFAKERKIAHNKQSKPEVYIFGNLIAVKPAALLEGQGFFAEPSVGINVNWPYNIDVDGHDDLTIAKLILAGGLVSLDRFDN